MKTLTEFASLHLKNAAKTKQELTTAGKTAEELPAALGEALKIEGDKLTFLLHALELVQAKLADLKRVIVFTLAETEKPPANATKHGEHYYLVEFYPSAQSQNERNAPSKDGKDGKGGRGDKKKPGGRDRTNRPARPPREDQRTNPAAKPPSITPAARVVVKPRQTPPDNAV